MSVQQLQDKLDRVNADINKIRSTGGSDHALMTLTDYKAYIEDELNRERAKNDSTSTSSGNSET